MESYEIVSCGDQKKQVMVVNKEGCTVNKHTELILFEEFEVPIGLDKEFASL